MQAIVLAAGRGSRLGVSGEGTPKCLLEIDRRPLIEHQLEALSEAGVGPVAMVVGYCADEIRERLGIKVEYISNPNWSTTNSLYSFLQARDWVKGPVMVLNSDILFHPEIVDRLLAVRGDAIAYQSSSGNGREHMKVKVIDGCVRDMSKDLPPDEVSGENVGILCLTEETARAIVARGEKLVENGGRKDWLGSAVREICREREIRAVDVGDLPWGEIDFVYDLERVRKEVWPEIQRTAWKRKPAWRLARVAGIVLFALVLAAAIVSGWLFRSKVELDRIAVEGPPAVKVSVGDGVQTWELLADGDVAEATVTGAIRIDARVLFAKGEVEKTAYVLEITVDGRHSQWHLFESKPSSKATYAGARIGKRERIELDVAEGARRLKIRLVASETGKALIRVRSLAVEEE